MSTFLVIIVVAALPIIAGASMVVRGVRGRRVDDHPVCRACGFDLSGRPNGQNVCSECGRPLAAPDAIRIGNRQRSPMLVFFGAVPLLFGFGIVALIGWSAIAGPDFDKHKPVSWLMAELRLGGAELQIRALSELNNRLIAGQLKSHQARSVAERALDVQADTRIAWYAPWGDFVERAHAMGQLTDAQWERYARQAPAGSRRLKARPRVRRGEPIPIRIADGSARVGSNCKLMAVARKTITLGGVAIERDRDAGGWTMNPRGEGGTEGNEVAPSTEALAQLPDGPHTLVIEYDLKLCASWETQDDPIARTTMRLAALIEIVPADATTVTLRPGPLPPAMQKEFQVTRRVQTADERVEIDITVPRTPDTGIGYRVFARHPVTGKEQELGLLAWQNPRSTMRTFMNAPSEIGDVPFDVVMRPDPAAALRTTDVFEIYDGELVFENVPLQVRTQPR